MYIWAVLHGQKRRRKRNDKDADIDLVNKNFYAIEKSVKELQVCHCLFLRQSVREGWYLHGVPAGKSDLDVFLIRK